MTPGTPVSNFSTAQQIFPFTARYFLPTLRSFQKSLC